MNMFLSNSLLLLNLTYFAFSLLKPNFKNKIFHFFIVIIGIILLSKINYTSNSIVGTLIMTLFYSLYIAVFFYGSLYKKVLVLILFILTISFSELFVANFMNYLFDLVPNLIDTFIYTLALIVSNTVSFIILLIITTFIKIDIAEKYSKFMWFNLILPVTTVLCLYNFTNYFSTFRNNILLLLIVLGLIISNIISFIAISREFKRLELDNDIRQTKMKYDLLNNQYNTNFYFLHDTIRTLTKLNNHMNENNFKDFQKCVVELNRNLTKSFNTINSNSELLNSLLNYRISDINKYNINIKTIIEHNDFHFITLEDRQSLFSELLSLSINTCINSKMSKPLIIIKTKKVNKQIIIQCTFSYSETDNLDLARLYSIIMEHDGHISEKVIKNKNLIYYDLIIVFLSSDRKHPFL